MERISELNLRNMSTNERKNLEIEDSFARNELLDKANKKDVNRVLEDTLQKIEKNSSDISDLSDIVDSKIGAAKMQELSEDKIDEIWNDIFG